MSYRSVEIALPVGATSPASAITVANAGVPGFSQFQSLTIIATIRGGTGGTLDVYIQHSADGLTWYDYVHFAQLAAGAAVVTYSYAPALNDTINTIGTGTTPALAAGSAAGGHMFDQLRVLYVAGASTSAGAAQVVKVLGVRDTP